MKGISVEDRLPDCDKCSNYKIACVCVGDEMNDDILAKVVREISDNHHKIIDDWCKAYLAQLYEEGHEIKPGCFTLNEQEPTYHKGQDCMVKRYWFEPGTPHWSETEWGKKQFLDIVNEKYQFGPDGEITERKHTHGWISVEDALPEIKENDNESENVLLLESDDEMYVGHLNFYPISGYRTQEEYTWSESSTGCGCCARNLKPTHWMKLPKSPRNS